MKGLNKQAFKVKSDPMSWMREEEYALAHQDEVRATTKIILHLINFMTKHQMSQTDLARELGVTPQYINKLLHGQDTSFRIETAILYGKKLGITLIEIPEHESDSVDYFTIQEEFLNKTALYQFPETFFLPTVAEMLPIKPNHKLKWNPKNQSVTA